MSQFGQKLKEFRQKTRDLEIYKPLTQQQIAELLEEKTGIAYSHVTISNWERNVSTIHQDERLLLVSLISILHTHQGVVSKEDAEELLHAGNYRRLNIPEMSQVNIEWLNEGEEKATVSNGEQAVSKIPDKSYKQLIGRQNELQRILNGFETGQLMPALFIVGLGGIGKTVLAREATEQASIANLFESVVWSSAKTEKFIGEDIEEIEGLDYDYDLDYLFNDIGRQCERLDITQMLFEEKQEAIAHLLAQKHFLIVLDNLETVKNADKLIDDILAIRGQSQLLITSRHLIDHPLVTPIRLTGFSLAEGLQFLRSEGEFRGIDAVSSAGDEVLKRIHEVTGGAPLAMKLVIGQLYWVSIDEVLQILIDAKFEEQDSDFYRFVFKHSWTLLALPAQKILVSMATFSVKMGGTRSAIQQVSRVEELAFMPALKLLVFMSLVDPSQNLQEKRYMIHQLTRYFILSDIVKKWG